MSFFQVTEDELSALRIKLKEALGEGHLWFMIKGSGLMVEIQT